jgi:ATP-dependent Clp protease adapter protein ClpS
MIKNIEKQKTTTLKADLVDIYYKNDSKTTFDFVIWTLTSFFNKSNKESVDIATLIHKNGEGLVQHRVLKNIAKTKINKIKQVSKDAGFPLEPFYKDI